MILPGRLSASHRPLAENIASKTVPGICTEKLQSGCRIKKRDVITITANGYKTLTFKISIKDDKLTVSSDSTPGDDMQLHVRLVGSFESALVNQKGYDASAVHPPM